MAIKMILEGGIFERHDIRGGRVFKEGTDPKDSKFGVIYSCSSKEDDSVDNDLGLDSAEFEGAWIGSKGAPIEGTPVDKSKFFRILGAYYYHDKPSKTTKVFGIAKTEAFGITEGGDKNLHHKKWVLDDQDPRGDKKPSVDESRFGDSKHGWSFIVEHKEGLPYPRSEDELKIFKEVECPELTELEGIETKKDGKTSTYNFEVKVIGDSAVPTARNFPLIFNNAPSAKRTIVPGSI